MISIIGITCILLALLLCIYYRNVVNPAALMLVLWGFMILFSGSGLYDVGIPSTAIYLIIVVGLSSFVIGTLLGERTETRIRQCRRFDSSLFSIDFNYKFLTLIMIAVMVFLMYQTGHAVNLIRRGYSLADIRKMLYAYEENEMRSSSLIVSLQKFFVDPAVCLLTSYIPAAILMKPGVNKEKHRVLLYGSVACLALSILSSGGRLNIVALALYFITCYVIQKDRGGDAIQRKRLRKTGVLVALVVLVLLVATLGITLIRGGHSFDLIRHLFIYLGAPIRFFEYNVDLVNAQGIDNYFGSSSLYGFFYPFFFILRIFTGSYPAFLTQMRAVAVTNLQDVVTMGSGIRINAFATLFFQPYLDGGLIGVVVFLFGFGFLSGYAYRSAIKNRNLYGLMFYMMFQYQIIFSMVRFWFTQVTHAVWVLFIIVAVVRVPTKQSTTHTDKNRTIYA